MNPDNQENIDQLLRYVAPVMQRVKSGEFDIPPRVLAALIKMVETKFPQPVVYSVDQMKVFLLKILSEKPMNGFEINSALDKANVRLKEEGRGIIYGLLDDLESSGKLTARWSESGSRMVKTYLVTDKGIGTLQKKLGTVPGIEAATRLILDFNPSAGA